MEQELKELDELKELIDDLKFWICQKVELETEKTRFVNNALPKIQSAENEKQQNFLKDEFGEISTAYHNLIETCNVHILNCKHIIEGYEV